MLSALAEHAAQAQDRLPARQVRKLCSVLAAIPGQEADEVLRALLPRLEGLSGKHAKRCLKRLVGEQLPRGWALHWYAGRAFYHHPEHGSQWARPGAALPGQWTSHLDAQGRTYYHHPEDGSRWERPREPTVRQ